LQIAVELVVLEVKLTMQIEIKSLPL